MCLRVRDWKLRGYHQLTRLEGKTKYTSTLEDIERMVYVAEFEAEQDSHLFSLCNAVQME